MANVDLIMPKMGESIIEATILKWLKKPGDKVEEDETILEIATDKVDSEIPSPVTGVLKEILFQEDDVVAVGKIIAVISTEASDTVEAPAQVTAAVQSAQVSQVSAPEVKTQQVSAPATATAREGAANGQLAPSATTRFYSPLVRSIAQEESLSISELDTIAGTGLNQRVTKKDILSYLKTRHSAPTATIQTVHTPVPAAQKSSTTASAPASISLNAGEEIIEMGRMRKLIADHMVNSKHTAPHVTSMVEADVTSLVQWRNSVKGKYIEKYGEKLTFTPILMEAVVKAIKDFPMINISLVGDKIIKKNYINLGMATALPSGNLIVPVIKNADHYNLQGLTHAVHDLAARARANKLKPDEIQGGTYTVTNVGTFGNVMGTPIINQPQVAILAMGAIRKRPAVLETDEGDVIAIRHMMFLSHSYDHRVVDGYLGGSFVRRVADYLEAFDTAREI